MAHELFGEQRHEQFAVYPSVGAVLVVLRQMTKCGQRLEALERKFVLPSQPITLKNGVDIEVAAAAHDSQMVPGELHGPGWNAAHSAGQTEAAFQEQAPESLQKKGLLHGEGGRRIVGVPDHRDGAPVLPIRAERGASGSAGDR